MAATIWLRIHLQLFQDFLPKPHYLHIVHKSSLGPQPNSEASLMLHHSYFALQVLCVSIPKTKF